MKYFRVVNWEKFQHYKNRNPSWIKLYQSILDNYEFQQLTAGERYILIGCWILAAKTGNRTPIDGRYIADSLRIETRNIPFSKLIALNFIEEIQDDKLKTDSNMLASCKQVATPEKEREKDKEREKNPPTPRKRENVIEPLEPIKFDSFWKSYPRKINKGGAIKKWNATLASEETDPDQLIVCANKYSMIVKGKEERFILHPATFLGPDRRWKDYLDSSSDSSDGGRDEIDYDEAAKPKPITKGVGDANL